MASEQFSLSWDNFHQNMSSGMNSLLENEDLVDVTLAVEGKYLKAHKMVLSVCSPYFKELFKTNPCKHPIVFMKDVSYVALSDLLQFMYQGEVQVSQENLTTFIKTAEALQIKGLTGDGNEVITEAELLFTENMESSTRSESELPHELHIKEVIKSKDVWKHFRKLSNASGQCKYCHVILAVRGSTLSNFVSHLRNQHNEKLTTSESSDDVILVEAPTESKKNTREPLELSEEPLQNVEEKHKVGKHRSVVWNHFVKISSTKATCNYCLLTFSYSGGSISNLARHMKTKHMRHRVRTGKRGRLSPLNVAELATLKPENIIVHQKRRRYETYEQITIENENEVDDNIPKTSRVRSRVWNYFTKIGANRAKCNYCSLTVNLSKSGTTTNLARHVRNRHMIKIRVMGEVPPEVRDYEDEFDCGSAEEGTKMFTIKLSDSPEKKEKKVVKSKRRSLIWNHFSRSNTNRSRCVYCHVEVSHSGGSTSNLARHLKSKHDLNWATHSSVKPELDSELMQEVVEDDDDVFEDKMQEDNDSDQKEDDDTVAKDPLVENQDEDF